MPIYVPLEAVSCLEYERWINEEVEERVVPRERLYLPALLRSEFLSFRLLEHPATALLLKRN